MTKNVLIAAIVFHVNFVGVAPSHISSQRPVQITATVVAYQVFSRLRLISGGLGREARTPVDHDELIARVNKPSGTLKKGQYIKLRFTNADDLTVHLPNHLFEKAESWHFSLMRDNRCDELATHVLYSEGGDGKEPNQSWKRLVGAEKEEIPPHVNLQCYVFGTRDFKK